jgi:hypothetical protein
MGARRAGRGILQAARTLAPEARRRAAQAVRPPVPCACAQGQPSGSLLRSRPVLAERRIWAGVASIRSAGERGRVVHSAGRRSVPHTDAAGGHRGFFTWGRAEPPTARAAEGPDPYAWLRDGESMEVQRFLKAENKYAARILKQVAPLEEALYAEMAARSPTHEEGDPEMIEGWAYYMRTTPASAFPIFCRRWSPPGEPPGEEEVLLDQVPPAAAPQRGARSARRALHPAATRSGPGCRACICAHAGRDVAHGAAPLCVDLQDLTVPHHAGLRRGHDRRRALHRSPPPRAARTARALSRARARARQGWSGTWRAAASCASLTTSSH